MEQLPGKTIERLSQYRRNLIACHAKGKEYIFSHELAEMHHIKAVQVRRDIMLIGYSGSLRKGYLVKDLIERIGEVLCAKQVSNVAIVGMGNLGKAITSYFHDHQSRFRIVAAFDVDKRKTDRAQAGIKCYHIEEISRVAQEKNIRIGIITVPPAVAAKTARLLCNAGIKGILNFTSVPLNLTPGVYLEEYDMFSSLEKVAYHVEQTHNAPLKKPVV